MYAEAFEVAEDIEDYDLFMDLFNETKSNVNLLEFAAAAFSPAATILHEEEGHVGAVNGVANNNLSTSADYRSESACSQSTYSDMQVVQRSKLQHNKYTKEHLKNYVPPLPSFKSKVFSAEMIKINIPKPELRTESTQEAIRARPPPPPPPIPGMAKRITDPAMLSAPVVTNRQANTNDLQSIEILPRVRGLTNLGNTCFFNAVMQCLAQTPYLLDVLKELSEPGEE